MLIRVFLLGFLSALLAFSNALAATSLESGGMVVIEAESVAAKGGWSKESKIGGAKGGSYLVWKGPDLFSSSKAGRDTLRYTFRIQKAGNYQMRWRSYIAHGNSNTEANDSWVRFPTGKNVGGQHGLNGWTKAYQNELRKWSWFAKTVDHVGNPIRQYFSKGDHVVEISGRSNGHAIDRIVLYRYGDVGFTESKFNNASASSKVGGVQPPQNTNPTPVAKPDPKPVVKPTSTPKPVVKPVPTPTPVVKPEPVVKPTPAPVAKPQNMTAPKVSVQGSTLKWQAINARSINIHDEFGGWIESLPGKTTQWTASSNGKYFVVATDNRSWESWGRSETVAVSALSDATGSASITDFSGIVYSSSALELFWSVDGANENTRFELLRNDNVVYNGDGRSYFDSQLMAGNAYQYRLRVKNNSQIADFRNLNLTTQDANGASDNRVDAVVLRGEVYSQSAVELDWDRASGGDAESTTYNLYRDGQLIYQSGALSYFVDGLNADSTYSFTLKAQNTNGVESEGYSINLSTFASDGSSYTSFGKPPASSARFGFEVWDSLPSSTQQSLPSDCMLSNQSETDTVYCYSAQDDRMIARTVTDNKSLWSYQLNQNMSVKALELAADNRVVVVAGSEDCIACASYDVTTLEANGAIASSATVLSSNRNSVAYNVDNSGLRSSVSADGQSVFIASKSFKAIDGGDVNDINGWIETGVNVVEVDIASGSVSGFQFVENADFASFNIPNQ